MIVLFNHKWTDVVAEWELFKGATRCYGKGLMIVVDGSWERMNINAWGVFNFVLMDFLRNVKGFDFYWCFMNWKKCNIESWENKLYDKIIKNLIDDYGRISVVVFLF